uniref:Ketoreductase (KR) domain-containing protein n=1 Tax=Bionectria ochroleuca TaxID=29856 RepID=A0A8H7MYZ2_BIOOC
MASSKGTILVTGANGGLGCSIVSRIISTPELALYHGIYVVRNATQASALDSVLNLKKRLCLGLFRRKYLSLLPLVFESWVEGKGKVDPEIKQALQEDDAIIGVPILALAKWDTASSLRDSRLGFVRGTVPRSVENAFRAIAIDERGDGASNRCYGRVKRIPLPHELSSVFLQATTIEEVSNVSFESGALLQSIVLILPRSLPTEKLSTGQPARYEGLLRSKSQVNHPPSWWSIPDKLSFGMFRGDRDRCVGEVVGSDRGLGNDI